MLTTLKIIEALGIYDNWTAEELCRHFHISLATLKRSFAEARHLGAKIESYREGGTSYYRLKNWTACKQRVNTWMDLIEKNSVLPAHAA